MPGRLAELTPERETMRKSVLVIGLIVVVIAGAFVALALAYGSDFYGVAAIVAAVGFGAAMVGVLALLANLVSTVQQLTSTVKQITDETVPLIGNVNETVSGVNTELARVDTIVASVQQISYRAENVAGVLQAAVANPLIKGIAFVTGTRAAVKAARKVT
jgi:uncharacterized protein YoxC